MFRNGFAIVNALLLSVMFVSCNNSAQPEKDVIITLENATMEKASYVVLWQQLDQNGSLVPEGIYNVNMVADDYRETKSFTISSRISPVRTFYKESQQIESGPKRFSLALYSEENAVADTVVFHFDVPRKVNVKLYITKD